jgi:hypothetical protein
VGVLVGKEEEMGSDGRDLQDSGIERNGTLLIRLERLLRLWSGSMGMRRRISMGHVRSRYSLPND